MKLIKHLTILITYSLLLSCNSDDDCGSPNWTIPANLETEYNCTNTKYQMDINLTDDYLIIRSQLEFDNLVTGTCMPNIDFSTYDLVIGKKVLTSGNTSINYNYMKHPCNNNKFLEVTFTQNATTEAPNITYHALIPKLEINETINLTLEILQ